MNRIFWFAVVLAASVLSGCLSFPVGETPPAKVTNDGPYVRRSCEFSFSCKGASSGWANWNATLFKERAQRSGRVGDVSVVGVDVGSHFGVVRIKGNARHTENAIGAFFTGLTYLMIPFPCYSNFVFDFTVVDGHGRVTNYHYTDSVRLHIGIPLILFMPFCDASSAKVEREVLSNVYDALLLRLTEDGVFD